MAAAALAAADPGCSVETGLPPAALEDPVVVLLGEEVGVARLAVPVTLVLEARCLEAEVARLAVPEARGLEAEAEAEAEGGRGEEAESGGLPKAGERVSALVRNWRRRLGVIDPMAAAMRLVAGCPGLLRQLARRWSAPKRRTPASAGVGRRAAGTPSGPKGPPPAAAPAAAAVATACRPVFPLLVTVGAPPVTVDRAGEAQGERRVSAAPLSRLFRGVPGAAEEPEEAAVAVEAPESVAWRPVLLLEASCPSCCCGAPWATGAWPLVAPVRWKGDRKVRRGVEPELGESTRERLRGVPGVSPGPASLPAPSPAPVPAPAAEGALNSPSLPPQPCAAAVVGWPLPRPVLRRTMGSSHTWASDGTPWPRPKSASCGGGAAAQRTLGASAGKVEKAVNSLSLSWGLPLPRREKGLRGRKQEARPHVGV